MTLKKYTININSAEKSQKQHIRVSSTGKPFSAGKGSSKIIGTTRDGRTNVIANTSRVSYDEFIASSQKKNEYNDTKSFIKDPIMEAIDEAIMAKEDWKSLVDNLDYDIVEQIMTENEVPEKTAQNIVDEAKKELIEYGNERMNAKIIKFDDLMDSVKYVAKPMRSGEEPFYMFRLGGKSYRVQDTAEVPKIAKKMGYKIIY